MPASGKNAGDGHSSNMFRGSTPIGKNLSKRLTRKVVVRGGIQDQFERVAVGDLLANC